MRRIVLLVCMSMMITSCGNILYNIFGTNLEKRECGPYIPAFTLFRANWRECTEAEAAATSTAVARTVVAATGTTQEKNASTQTPSIAASPVATTTNTMQATATETPSMTPVPTKIPPTMTFVPANSATPIPADTPTALPTETITVLPTDTLVPTETPTATEEPIATSKPYKKPIDPPAATAVPATKVPNTPVPTKVPNTPVPTDSGPDVPSP